MNIVLLSGGSGKRLWPLSNDVRSKQFIKIYKTDTDDYESMVQRVYRQIKSVCDESKVTIVTAKTQMSAIYNQLPNQVNICIEPCRKNTFPAIALVTSYLYDVQGLSEDEVVIICPISPYVENDYFQSMTELECLINENDVNLVLMGIEPSRPTDKYGYIIPKTKSKVSEVEFFKEKPDKETAEKYIRQGALWNSGVFAYKIKYVLDKAHELIAYTDYYDLVSKYSELEEKSFECTLVENEKKILVKRFNGQWKHIATWDEFVNVMGDDYIGEARISASCRNTHVVNELDMPILCMGLSDVVVAASPEGILVSNIQESRKIDTYVNEITHQIKIADKSWGSYRVLDVADGSMTVCITLDKGNQMNYHSHEHRDEVWTIISGNGYTIVDGMKQNISAGDVITMAAGCRHTVVAESELKIIEVQLGKDISVEDKKKYELE